MRDVGGCGHDRRHVPGAVRSGALWPLLLRAHCRHLRWRVHRGLLLHRWLLLRHSKRVPAGHLRRRHGAHHRRLHGALLHRLLRRHGGAHSKHVHRAVRCGLLRVRHRPNCVNVQRPVRVRHLGRRGYDNHHLHGPVRRRPLRPSFVCAHCRHLRRRVHRGLLLPRWLLLRHAKRMPAGHLRRRHGARHRCLHGAVRRRLLRVRRRPNCAHVQRPVRVRHLRRHHWAHSFHLHGPVQCGPLRPGRICSHRSLVRRRMHCGLLLPRGVVHRNGGAVPSRLILPGGRRRAHRMRLPCAVPCWLQCQCGHVQRHRHIHCN